MSNATWGLETGILAITTHSLKEGVIGYELATYSARITDKDEQALDTDLLNKAAIRIIGTGITVRRKILHMLADTRAMKNHYKSCKHPR